MIDGEALFKLHDTYGFHLADSVVECRRRGRRADIEGFRRAALCAGWRPEKVEATVREALEDAT